MNSRTRMLKARQTILAAGGQSDAKHRSRAFAKIAAALPVNPHTGLPYNPQTVRAWYDAGRIPRGHLETVAKMAEIQPWEVDDVEFPPPEAAQAPPGRAAARV